MIRILVPLILAILFWLPITGHSQDSAGIESILHLAGRYYPSSNAADRYDKALSASLTAERAYLLPMVNLNGQATWQSDVTSVDIGFPADLPFNIDLDIPQPSRDQYKLSLDLTQRIYQGGAIHLQEKARELEFAIQQEQLKAGINAWQQQAADCFYRIRGLETSSAIIMAYHEDLTARKRSVESAMVHGVADQISGELLAAEVLELEQQLDELGRAVRAQRSLLVTLTGDSSLLYRSLRPTALNVDTTLNFRRPELQITDLQIRQLETAGELLTSSGLPMITGFGQLGYGRPGLNMLDDAFAPFAIAGIRMSWALWDNRMKKHRRDALSFQQEASSMHLETTRKGLAGQAIICDAEIRKYESMITRDMEILVHREAVSRGASSQLVNGVITAAEYIRQKNEEVRARLKLEAHRISLEQALVDYRFILGTW